MKYLQEKSFVAVMSIRHRGDAKKFFPIDSWEGDDRSNGWLTVNDSTLDTRPMKFWFGCYGLSEGVGTYVIRCYATNDATEDVRAFHGYKVRYSREFGHLQLHDDPSVRADIGELFFIDFNGKPDAGQFKTSDMVGPFQLLGVHADDQVSIIGQKSTYHSIPCRYLMMRKGKSFDPFWFHIAIANAPEMTL